MRTAGQGPGGFEKREGEMVPGQDLVMAGYAGLEGTRKIKEYYRERLTGWFSPAFLSGLDQADSYDIKSSIKDMTAQKDCSITACEYAEEGGVLAALWNLSGIFNAGIDVDLRQMPIKQITVEICERFGLNPYRLLCKNCILIAAHRGNQVVRELNRQNIPAAVIGCVVSGGARQVRHGEETAGYLERPRPDEWNRLIDQQQKNGGNDK